jgi:phosphoglycolate phosphatase-like HAD superfamily hydrolase
MKRRSVGALQQRAERPYMRVASPRGRFAVGRPSMGILAKVDAVVFDCDGVLIDARKSYDATIRVVVEEMVEGITGARLRLGRAVPRLISTIRRTGGFNSDWDTTYALTLFSVAAVARRGARGAVEALAGVTASFGSAPRGRGKAAVDSFLGGEFPSMAGRLDAAREYLGYPSTPPDGRMTTAFDELYFGAALYERVYGARAGARRKSGLIELERALVSRRTLGALTKVLGEQRLAVVTGRPFLGTEHSLGKAIMASFDRGASMFIGDADIDPSLRPEYDRYRKPSPDALLRARERLSSETLLYVGDSAEDLMMAQAAKRESPRGFLFAGVYETSPVRADQASFFEREGADLVLGTVDQVPSGLLLARKGEGAR